MSRRNDSWVCPKCGNRGADVDQLQATGGNFAKLFDVQNKKFNTVSCTKCGYTELYRGETDDLMNVIDFLFGEGGKNEIRCNRNGKRRCYER